MILKNPSSRIFLVNLFADFILSKIPSVESSIIKVIDCKNFFVVKGKTSSKDLLNLTEIISEFSIKFSSYLSINKITHTIDLIEYNQNLSFENRISYTYHNSENCSYSTEQIKAFERKQSSYDFFFNLNEITDDEMIFQSEFPHGYSLNQGRLLFYYGKHIMYNVPPTYPVSYLTFDISTNKNEDSEQIFSVQKNEMLTSAILDVFDFDMNWLENEIKKVDWSFELTNPLEEYSFLKKIVEGFIIL
jgi:hypothetical protein